MTNFPSENDFLKLSKRGNLIPIYRDILGDLDTPVSTYYKLAANAKFSFLLESVEGEEKVARFSFLARDPELVLKCTNGTIEITKLENGQVQQSSQPVNNSPLTSIREVLSKYRFVTIPGLPRFCGGLVGYLGYDTVRYFERLPQKPQDDLRLPDVFLVLAKQLVIFDHRNHTIKLVDCCYLEDGISDEGKRSAYTQAVKRIDELETAICKTAVVVNAPVKASGAVAEPDSNVSQKEFESMVRSAKKDILAGEIIQVVLSQRLKMNLSADGLQIYRMLRSLNPSPYMYYLNFDGLQVVGSSPELLVRCEDGVVETRPIAGTRPRGKDEKADQRLIKELLNDPKEKAEHIMLVDLGRNDLGRVCQRGTVRVTDFMTIEKYSHVMHLVSNVRGTLRREFDALDVLQAAFPAGTVSGAPKIRAMEIIDRLENVARGPYAGCVGYFSFSGNLDTCITIRTIVIVNNTAYIQAGAGIVADSIPNKEYHETLSKARAQIQAIERANAIFTS